jgi:predicted enzyme related to lactoylglutathione lyase
MINIRPRELVILADDFAKLYAWYRDVLGFKVTKLFDDDYHYCNMETDSGIKIGIASAKEMDMVPGKRANNTVVLQIEVDDLKELYTHMKEHGVTELNGPFFDKKNGFWFGGFSDVEGNPCWVVDKNCP